MENKNIDSVVSQKSHSCGCGKSYKYKSGLMKHSEKCKWTEKEVSSPEESKEEVSRVIEVSRVNEVIEVSSPEEVSPEEQAAIDAKEKERLARRGRLQRLEKLYNTLDEVTRENSDLQFEKLGLQIHIKDLQMQVEDLQEVNREYKEKIVKLRENVDANTNTKNTLRFHFPDKPISSTLMNHYTEQITRCLEMFYSRNGMEFPKVEY
jgi:predicted RNase H-like nuclease (RuvC/YqgF family)